MRRYIFADTAIAERNNDPVFSLSDMDFYKFPMGQYAFYFLRGIIVTFELIIRDKTMPTADIIPERTLRRALDRLRARSFEQRLIQRLRATGYFTEEYLSFLSTAKLPPYHLERRGSQYVLTFTGPYELVKYWETIGMATFSELLYREVMKDLTRDELEDIYQAADKRLVGTLNALREYPDIKFSEFGHRRRHARWWQSHVIESAKILMPKQLLGTSNVWMAGEHGIKPGGTNAHSQQMVEIALAETDDEMRAAQYEVYRKWYELYKDHPELLVLLTDTEGSAQWYANAPSWLAHEYKGDRQVSGEPIAQGELTMAWLESHGVDPMSWNTMFSDGLSAKSAITIHTHFAGIHQHNFGIGTNMTNDFVGIAPELPYLRQFSMACKVVRVIDRQGRTKSAVKLSNNEGKGTGLDLEHHRRVFGSGGRISEKPLV